MSTNIPFRVRSMSPHVFRTEYTNMVQTDSIEITNITFELVQSYDLKQWDRLRGLLAPAVRADFRGLGGPLCETLTPDEYVAFISSDKIIGDPRLKTQHLLGGSHWERLGYDWVHVSHQIRAAHQHYADNDLKVVVNKGHALGLEKVWYRKIEGTWKISGCTPELNWAEYDFFGTVDPSKAVNMFEESSPSKAE